MSHVTGPSLSGSSLRAHKTWRTLEPAHGMIYFVPEAAEEYGRLGIAVADVSGKGVPAALYMMVTKGLLDATTTLKFATGIINIWKHEPADLVAWWKSQSPARQARLFLGLGVSHGPLIGESWAKPLAKMKTFLDGIDTAVLPRERLCLAALGPKMLELSRERTAGAHPYMVSARHTAFARKTLGKDAILAPELGELPINARRKNRQFLTQRGRRGFLAVGARQHGQRAVAIGETGNPRNALLELRNQLSLGKFLEGERVGQIVDVLAGAAEMYQLDGQFSVHRRHAFFEEILDRLHVVVGLGLELLDQSRRESG